jgi:Kef-type K+ transport system membrane component KefB
LESIMTNRTSALGARIFEAFLLLLLLAVTLKLSGDLPWSWLAILAPAWVPVLVLMLGMAGWIGAHLLRRRPRVPSSESATPVARIMTVRQAFASRALTESLTGSR